MLASRANAAVIQSMSAVVDRACVICAFQRSLALAGVVFQYETVSASGKSQARKARDFKDKGACAEIPAPNQFLSQTASIFIKSQPPVHILGQ